MPAMRLAVLCLSVLLIGVPGSPAAAQLRGVIADPDGRPVPGATVELWGASARLGRTTTDARGEFGFTAEAAAGAGAVTVQRIGFAPLTRAVAPPASLELRLEPLAVPLPELRSRTARRACPNREEPAARRLWEAARRRYDAGIASRGISSVSRTWSGIVDARDVGIVDEDRMHGATAGGHGEATGVDGMVRRWGYAAPKSLGYIPWGISWQDDFFAWSYPALHERYAYHFAGDTFGALHALSVLSAGDGATTLGFCPRGRERTAIEGTLTLGADGSFLSAAWSFRTPRPREDAGGEVVFAPRSTGVRPLLPVRGVFWRRMGGSRRYWQRASTYTAWFVGQDSTMPVRPWVPRSR
ncbi:MAG: carboxypeptidase-like regulatory domain-containing protein [Longimicrobiaceae bacterium]